MAVWQNIEGQGQWNGMSEWQGGAQEQQSRAAWEHLNSKRSSRVTFLNVKIV